VTEPEKIPILAAYYDHKLFVEAAHQLLNMAKDESIPVGKGQDLPEGDPEALLQKAAARKAQRKEQS
jgi:hypothetical protein